MWSSKRLIKFDQVINYDYSNRFTNEELESLKSEIQSASVKVNDSLQDIQNILEKFSRQASSRHV